MNLLFRFRWFGQVVINNYDGEEECDVLDTGYMRAEQDVTEHPLGVQVNDSYYVSKAEDRKK